MNELSNIVAILPSSERKTCTENLIYTATSDSVSDYPHATSSITLYPLAISEVANDIETMGSGTLRKVGSATLPPIRIPSGAYRSICHSADHYGHPPGIDRVLLLISVLGARLPSRHGAAWGVVDLSTIVSLCLSRVKVMHAFNALAFVKKHAIILGTWPSSLVILSIIFLHLHGRRGTSR
jgi:hypothetical protein